MANSGSAVAATNTVNTLEYVAVIKEGQVRNYIWDTANSTWVKDPGTIVNISGLQITVDVSGDPVNVSGSAVFVYVSGGAISVISGGIVSISGNHVDTSGNYFASGQSVITSVSGNHVDTSGNYFASGQSVVTSVSGNAVTASFTYTPKSTQAVGSGAITLTYTNDATPRFFEYAEYHATSGAVLSSTPLLIQHISSTSGYTVNMYSLKMETNATSDVFYQPDNPTILDSGDGVKISWANIDACAYYARIMTRR